DVVDHVPIGTVEIDGTVRKRKVAQPPEAAGLDFPTRGCDARPSLAGGRSGRGVGLAHRLAAEVAQLFGDDLGSGRNLLAVVRVVGGALSIPAIEHVLGVG